MTRFFKFITPIFVGVILSTSVYAEGKSWSELNAQVASLYQKGMYTEAVPVAQEALNVAESIYGPEKPEVALSLNNLALIYKVQKGTRKRSRSTCARWLFQKKSWALITPILP